MFDVAAQLVEKNYLTPDVLFLKFAISAPPALSMVCGQYLIALIPNGQGEPLRRLYSVASPCINTRSFSLVVKLIPQGVASGYFKAMSVGDTLDFKGPAGVFTLKDTAGDKFFLVTGTGIAPVKAMMEEIVGNPQKHNLKLRLLWGLRTYADVYFLAEMKEWERVLPNFKFRICLSRLETLDEIPADDRKYFFQGRLTKLIDEDNDPEAMRVDPAHLPHSEFYICGDRDVVESLKTYLASKGFSRDTVISEKF